MAGIRRFSRCLALGVIFLTAFSAFTRDSTPRWIRVNSSHFSVLTDADESKGREIAVRFEQMAGTFGDVLNRNVVRMPKPLDIITFKNDEEYAKAAPPGQSGGGFFLLGTNRDFVVLNLGQTESWRSIEYPFAFMLLDGNYPPAQPWFDQGVAQYFASYRPGDKQASIGDDPSGGDLTAQLSRGHWLSIADLFGKKNSEDKVAAESGPPNIGPSNDEFAAQSWITIHYLIRKEKLAETGTYLGLIALQKMPVDKAIQQAYGISAAELDKNVHEYFQGLAPELSAKGGGAQSAADSGNIGATPRPATLGEAQALVDEMELRIPAHREAAIRDLNLLTNDPKIDNSVAHRALAWDFLQHKDFTKANEELDKGLHLNQGDPWVRFYLSEMRYAQALATGKTIDSLPNMMQDLRIVLDWHSEFAEAYHLLGVARLQGGGTTAAMESMHAAIQLAPRRPDYLLDMADIYLAGKKWDAATSMLQLLAANDDPHVAASANKKLKDIPALKKYGRVLEDTTGTPVTSEAPVTNSRPEVATAKEGSAEVEVSSEQPLGPPPDRRSIQFAKGTLLRVDCTHDPIAILTVATGAKTLSLRTENYKELVVVGAKALSCTWINRAVSVNYKSAGKSDGDLISLEVR